MSDYDKRPIKDVRMRGFAHRHTVDAALAWLDAQLRPPGDETRAPADGRGPRVGDRRRQRRGRARIRPRHDGRLRGRRGKHGRGDVLQPPSAGRDRRLAAGTSLSTARSRAGQAVRIMTGAPLPPGCDAVLPAEWIDRRDAGPMRVRQRPRRRIARQDMSAGAARTSSAERRCSSPDACCARRISACSARSAWARCRCSAGRACGWW